MIIFIIVASIILDRLTKYLAVKFLAGLPTLPIIKNVIHLTYTRNTGAAFSIFSGKTMYLALFTLVVVVALTFFLISQKKKNPDKKMYLYSIAMIIGGAIGNMIDRFFLGYVVDFIDFTLINFAVFNVADIFITIGGILFCICLIFDKQIKM